MASSGTLAGLNSYGYSGIKFMYGPKFNANTTTTYQRRQRHRLTVNTLVSAP